MIYSGEINYEKKYKEALEKARKTLEKSSAKDVAKLVVEYFFPELAESEDEVTRKWILDYLCDGLRKSDKQFKDQFKSAIAWLEKQKEQHPFSKFLPGDWAVYDGPLGHAILQIKDVVGGRYSFVDNVSTLLVEDSDEYLRPLTPKDVEKKAECLKAERDGWYVCIKDFYVGGKKQCSVGDLVQAKGGMYMMGIEDISKWFRRAYYEDVRDAFGPNTDTNIPEQKPAEWSEKDKVMLISCISSIEEAKENRYAYKETDGDTSYDHEIAWLKSLRPSWKPSEEQMSMLLAVINDPNNAGAESCYMALKSIYNNLKKL